MNLKLNPNKIQMCIRRGIYLLLMIRWKIMGILILLRVILKIKFIKL